MRVHVREHSFSVAELLLRIHTHTCMPATCLQMCAARTPRCGCAVCVCVCKGMVCCVCVYVRVCVSVRVYTRVHVRVCIALSRQFTPHKVLTSPCLLCPADILLPAPWVAWPQEFGVPLPETEATVVERGLSWDEIECVSISMKRRAPTLHACACARARARASALHNHAKLRVCTRARTLNACSHTHALTPPRACARAQTC